MTATTDRADTALTTDLDLRRKVVQVGRVFTREGENPYDTVEWKVFQCRLTDDRTGAVLFEQEVEAPAGWSQSAVDIVASKYFRKAGVPQHDAEGHPLLDEEGRPVLGGERSVRQVVHRLAGCWAAWGRDAGYFDAEQEKVFYEEVVWLLLHQYFAPNSPQWFNTGLYWAYGIDNTAQKRYFFDPTKGEVVETRSRYQRPEPMACYLSNVQDSLTEEAGIAEFIGREMRIFQAGAGSGANFSTLRAKGERLSGGGTSSGMMSFLKVFDRSAGAIKSGGTTRRAAKMVVVDADHPEVEEFIWWKVNEEKKVAALVSAGYDSDWRGEAYETVSGQNANNSVSVSHDFMRAVLEDGDWHLTARTTGEVMRTVRARDLWRQIAEAAWMAADPGLQFNGTMNDWNPVPHVGPIRTTNPCFPGDVRVATDRGLIRIRDLVARAAQGETHMVATHDATNPDRPSETVTLSAPVRYMVTGFNPIVRLTFTDGRTLRCTPNHRLWTENRGWVRADELTSEDEVRFLDQRVGQPLASWDLPEQARQVARQRAERDCVLPEKWSLDLAHYLGWLVSDGSFQATQLQTVYGATEDQTEVLPRHQRFVGTLYGRYEHSDDDPPVGNVRTLENGVVHFAVPRRMLQRFVAALGLRQGTRAHEKRVPEAIFEAPEEVVAEFLHGLFDADGTVVVQDANASRYVGLGSASLELLRDVQLLLSAFGIASRIYQTRAGKSKGFRYTTVKGEERVYESRALWDLRITGSSLERFASEIGFTLRRKQDKLHSLIAHTSRYQSRHTTRLVERSEDGVELTYNLTEPRNHSYTANGLVVSNCSEAMQVDDSACNLASLRLTAFLRPDGSFDADRYAAAARLVQMVLEISVHMAQFPDPKVAYNTYHLRYTGLGYADLGALLMRQGLPYDSEEGRAAAAALTSLLTATASAASAEMAEVAGPYGFYKAENHLRVVRNHRAAHVGGEFDRLEVRPYVIDQQALPEWARPVFDRGAEMWDRALELGELYGFRNAQTTLAAPTGTISFAMGCDTTGIEPDFSLVKWKTLAGGGAMQIVNQSVQPALERLGYDDTQTAAIISYIEEHGSAEGAPGLRPEHLPVFDTAVGNRAISPEGHVRMLAALQPFFSAGMSKTVNLPKEATAEDIERLHLLAYQLGVKCIAVYRDGSKLSQVLSSQKEESSKAERRSEDTFETLRKLLTSPPAGVSPQAFYEQFQLDGAPRFKLPAARTGRTWEIKVGGTKVFLRTGEFEDGSLGEIFLDLAKEGATLRGVLSCFAMAVSHGLQAGIPLRKFVDQFTLQTFEPRGIVERHDHVKMATSIIDAVFRILAVHYLRDDSLAQVKLADGQLALEADDEDAPRQVREDASVGDHQPALPRTERNRPAEPRQIATGETCGVCGGPTVRTGTCLTCTQCGSVSGGCG